MLGILAYSVIPVRSGGLIITIVILLFPTVVALTGNAYVNKKDKDGYLKRWSLNIVPLLFLCIAIFTMFVA